MSAPSATSAPSAHGEAARPARRPRFANWCEHHGWSALSSLRRLASRPLGSLLTIAVMGVALALPLAFFLLLGNVERLGGALGTNQVVNVFLAPDQAAAQAEALAARIGARTDAVSAVRVKTPQQGLRELAGMQGFSQAMGLLDGNPLPFVLEVEPRADAAAAVVAALAADVRAMPGVDVVQDAGVFRQRLEALLGVGHRIALVLAGLLALAAVLVVGNTIRVDIAGRREEIGILVLLGAGGAFIRRPYVYAGAWYGLLGGALAVALVAGTEWLLAAPAAALSEAYGGRLAASGLPWWLLLGTPLATAVLGWFAARVVSAWQLRAAA